MAIPLHAGYHTQPAFPPQAALPSPRLLQRGSGGGAKQQMIIFKVGAEEFAVDIMLVKEVVMMRDITPVPETAVFVEGVMNLRGNLVPVLDLRKRLRARHVQNGTEQRILIALFNGKLI